MSGLHLSLFRNPTHVVTSSYHVKQCLEKFVAILRAVTGGDRDLYLHLIFQRVMEQLNCAEENGIIKVGPQVLMRELSQRLAAFCDVLAHPSSGTNSPRQLSQDLRDSLEINGDALWEKDRRHKDEKRDKRLSALEQGWDAKKPRHDEVDGAEVGGGFGGGSR